ncbi:MAG: tripartite tricarboxylate transporter substrate binding protein [Synergistaceae bacterium]|nr:tripartite tricarboxylate transporter substrate binding protein [Synergistaceae bacterium]
MRTRFVHVYLALITCMLIVFTSNAAFAVYPERPIKMVVTYKPGGGNDATARVFAKYSEEYFGQPIIITNIDGAGGIVGAREVYKAKPDGYTLLWMHEALTTGNLTGVADFKWSDLTPICQTCATADVIVVRSDFPAKNIDEFIEYVKNNPKKVRMPINIGATTHFEMAAIDIAAGGNKIVHVASGGGSDRLQKLLGGFVEAASLNAPTVPQYVQSGQIRALAVSTPERSPFLPEVPTFKEKGYNVVKPYNMNVFGPAKMDSDVVRTISETFKKMSEDPRVKSDLAKFLAMPHYLDQTELEKFLKELDRNFGEIAEKANLKK